METAFSIRLSLSQAFLLKRELKSWYLDLYNNQGKLVRGLEGPGIPPTLLTWDGTGENGKIVPDGTYHFAMSLTYNSGNHPASETGKVTVDCTHPDYHFVVSPKLFSPDGDGEADTMYINAELYDRNNVSDWEIAIYRKWDEKIDRTAPFKKYTGKEIISIP